MSLDGITIHMILCGIFFGLWGGYLIKLGKSRQSVELYFIGFALIGYGYFVTNTFLVYTVGIVLTVISLKMLT